MSDRTTIDAKTDSELLSSAAALRQEAWALLNEGGVLDCFGQADAAKVVGSAATGLMTKRDIDITCCLDPLEATALLRVGQRMAERLPVARMTYINPLVTPWHSYTKGLYCGVRVQVPDDALWNLDIWAYSPADFAEAMASHRGLAARLSTVEPARILRLKKACTYPSHSVYTVVLDHDVRTVQELEQYVAHGGN